MLLRTLPAIDQQEKAAKDNDDSMPDFRPRVNEMIRNGRARDAEAYARSRNIDLNSAPQGKEGEPR